MGRAVASDSSDSEACRTQLTGWYRPDWTSGSHTGLICSACGDEAADFMIAGRRTFPYVTLPVAL